MSEEGIIDFLTRALVTLATWVLIAIIVVTTYKLIVPQKPGTGVDANGHPYLNEPIPCDSTPEADEHKTCLEWMKNKPYGYWTMITTTTTTLPAKNTNFGWPGPEFHDYCRGYKKDKTNPCVTQQLKDCSIPRYCTTSTTTTMP